jgi:hypothetical protein
LLFRLLFLRAVAVIGRDRPGRYIVVGAFALRLRDDGLRAEGQDNRWQNQNFFHDALYFQTVYQVACDDRSQGKRAVRRPF